MNACESAGLCRVNLCHHYKLLWMSAWIMFGQRCLMGCHSLPRQYYYPTWFPTSPSSALFSFHMLFSTISGFSLSLMTTFHTSKRVLFFLFTIAFYFFSCSVWHICCCLVGRLCSPVINLFCRSPSALCLVLFSIPFSSSSYSPLPTFLPALLSPLTSHTR